LLLWLPLLLLLWMLSRRFVFAGAALFMTITTLLVS
jgi:hypothetical protein